MDDVFWDIILWIPWWTAILSVAGNKLLDKSFFVFTLNTQYKHEQRAKLKDFLGKTKTGLLNSAEDMQYRLWNFREKISENWHCQTEKTWKDPTKYYIQSFVYRFLEFFYFARKVRSDIFFVDSTVATRQDYTYLKYIKALQLLFCDADLLNTEQHPYTGKKPKHHFYKDVFYNFPAFIVKDGNILNFDSFKEKIQGNTEKIEPIRNYIALCENKNDNLNYCTMQLFHLLLLAFLNTYGFDYQRTDKEKLIQIVKSYKGNMLFTNFKRFLEKHKLSREKAILKIIKIYEKTNCC